MIHMKRIRPSWRQKSYFIERNASSFFCEASTNAKPDMKMNEGATMPLMKLSMGYHHSWRIMAFSIELTTWTSIITSIAMPRMRSTNARRDFITHTGVQINLRTYFYAGNIISIAFPDGKIRFIKRITDYVIRKNQIT